MVNWPELEDFMIVSSFYRRISMIELRAQEASTPGFKDAFLETTEPARQLVDSVFGRLQWTYSRAVHIEILDDLSTDSFINSFRQVTSVRGNIRKLFCDRGTNFVGASSDFKQAFDSMKDSELKSKLAKLGCEFVFNPPSASHMGGVWERQIRSIRSILTNLINKHPCRVNSSELRTLFCETMAVINSRPLSVEN